MKLISYDLEKMPNKRIGLRLLLKDQMRRPVDVKIEVTPGDPMNQANSLVLKDTEMPGFLNAMGEIAWASGWRPRALPETVAQVIRSFKEPKDEQ